MILEWLAILLPYEANCKSVPLQTPMIRKTD